MDVMHVSSLKINLISLGAIDSKGCKCNIEGGVVKVVNEIFVLMKGEMVGSLYKLIGEAIPSGVVKESSDNTRRKDIVQVELDATKSSKDGLTGSSKISLNGNRGRPECRQFSREKGHLGSDLSRSEGKISIVGEEIVARLTERTPEWRQRKKDLQGVSKIQIWEGLFCLDEWK